MHQPKRYRGIAIHASLLCVCTGCFAIDMNVDMKQGQALHDEDCLVCHDTGIYSRDSQRIRALQELVARVEMCQQDVGADWDDSQFDAVITYLNSFYRFEKIGPALRKIFSD